MALLVPNTGEIWMLQQITSFQATPTTLYLKLFKNDYTPTESDAIGNYVEATFSGYANVALTGSSWVIGANTSGYSNAQFAVQTFTSDQAQTSNNIYGYFITANVASNTSGQLVWAERFTDGPYPISNNGDAIKVTPYIELA